MAYKQITLLNFLRKKLLLESVEQGTSTEGEIGENEGT